MIFPDIDEGQIASDVEAAERAWMAAWLSRDIDTCTDILD